MLPRWWNLHVPQFWLDHTHGPRPYVHGRTEQTAALIFELYTVQ
jgi:hypothetical protein